MFDTLRIIGVFLAEADADTQASWRGQMMMLAGLAMLIWVLFRRHFRVRARGREHDRDIVRQRREWDSQTKSGAPLADAPPGLARWQAGMFDLQRDLKAELDSKISVLQSMVRQADERIAALSQLAPAGTGGFTSDLGERSTDSVGSAVATHSAPALAETARKVRQLTDKGFSAKEIAHQLSLSLGDVEFLQGIA